MFIQSVFSESSVELRGKKSIHAHFVLCLIVLHEDRN